MRPDLKQRLRYTSALMCNMTSFERHFATRQPDMKLSEGKFTNHLPAELEGTVSKL